jgi:hypothetical protein
MIANFLDNPSGAPDSSCMAQMKGITFITNIFPNKGALNIFIRVQNPKSPFSLAIIIVSLPFVFFRARRKGTAVKLLLNLARLTLWIASIFNAVFIIGACILAKQALAQNYGWATLVGFSPASSRYLFWLPWVALFLTLSLLVSLFFGWKNSWWKRVERLVFSSGTVAAVCLSGIFIYLKVLTI